MVFLQTILKIIDNSGAVFAKCIKLPRQSNRGGGVGDVVTVVVKKSFIKKKIKKSKEIKTGQICNALIIRTKIWMRRWGSFYLKSGSNSGILINKSYSPYGSRIVGLLFREVRTNLNFSKIMSLTYINI